MFDEVMSSDEAGKPEQECPLRERALSDDGPQSEEGTKFRYIYPVRYALSEAFLQNVYFGKITNKNSIDLPTRISDIGPINKDFSHDLRRMRDGYIFVLYDTGNGKMTWREFRSLWLAFKTTQQKQSQSELIDPPLDTFRQNGARKPSFFHVFNEFRWKDGNCENPTYHTSDDFIKIPKNITTIWIGFTEARWTRKMLETIELDEDFRKAFMSKVNIEEKDGAHVCKFNKDNWPKVADFRKENLASKNITINLIGKNLSASVLNNAPIYHQDAEALRKPLGRGDRKNARIVALRDDCGEAEEMANVHGLLLAEYERKLNESKYALMIGGIARNLIKSDQELPEDKKIGFKDCFRETFESDLKEIEENIKTACEKCRLPVELHDRILSRKDNLSCSNQIEKTLNLVNNSTSSHDHDVWEHACYQSVCATLGMSSSPVGLEMIMNSKNFNGIRFWKIFKNLAQKGAEISRNIKAQKLYNFQVFTSHNINVIHSFTHLKKSVKISNQEWSTAIKNVEFIFNQGSKTQTVSTAAELDKYIENCRERYVRKISDRIRIPKYNNVFINTDNHKLSLDLKQPTKVNISLEPTERYQAFNTKLNLISGGANMIYAVFAGIRLFELVGELANNDEKTKEYNFYYSLEIVSSVSSMVQGVVEAHKAFGQTVGASKQLTHALTKVNSFNIVGGASRAVILSGCRGLLYSLSAVMFAHSLFEMGRALHRGDGYAAAGYGIFAAGSALSALSVLIVIPGAQWIVIAALIIGTIFLLLQDSEIETWAKSCFWGKARKYFYWDKEPRPSLTDQLRQSYSLAKGDKIMEGYFEHELEVIRVLTARITFSKIYIGGVQTNIAQCPLFESQEDCENLDVTPIYYYSDMVEQSSITASGNISVSSGSVNKQIGINLSNFIQIKCKKFLYPGVIELEYGMTENTPVRDAALYCEKWDGKTNYAQVAASPPADVTTVNAHITKEGLMGATDTDGSLIDYDYKYGYYKVATYKYKYKSMGARNAEDQQEHTIIAQSDTMWISKRQKQFSILVVTGTKNEDSDEPSPPPQTPPKLPDFPNVPTAGNDEEIIIEDETE